MKVFQEETQKLYKQYPRLPSGYEVRMVARKLDVIDKTPMEMYTRFKDLENGDADDVDGMLPCENAFGQTIEESQSSLEAPPGYMLVRADKAGAPDLLLLLAI